MRWRPILFFVVLVALATLAGIMREDALRKMTYTQSHSSRTCGVDTGIAIL